MRERAVEAGMTVAANTEVLGLDVEHGRITRVRTDRGDIEADRVVIACGCWSPRIARMAGASIPLTPAVHQMIDIGPVAASPTPRPSSITRSCATWTPTCTSARTGAAWRSAPTPTARSLIDADEIPSIEESALSPTELPFTQQDFDLQMEQALELMPEIVGDESVGVSYAINGLLSVTYDGLPLIGETPEVKGLWSAAAIWIKEGPGAGKTVAELMVHGESEIDVYDSNIARAYPHQKTKSHIQARAGEGFNKMYGIVHPAEQWESDRRVKLSPYYEREQELGAVFYEAAGWERPQWYESNAPLLEEYGDRVTRREAEWESRWWSPIINAEHLALRDRAGYTDLTAFAIFDVSGPGALEAVQQVAMRQMDVPVGRVVYTPVLLPAGGFKADLTIMRIGDDVFRVVTGGAWGMSDLKWFSDHLPEDGRAQIHDQTNAWTTLGLWGPRARDILSSVTSDDVSHEGFPFARWKSIEVGPLQVIASRISYVGDLGWELYVPIEQGARLWDIVAEAGLPHGAVPVGAGVYGTTGRLEKCYRAYGAELEGEYNVVEAGMAWGKVKDQDFVGKDAHVRQRDEEPAATMCTLTVDDHTSSSGVKRYMMGGEPILTRRRRPDHRRQGPALIRHQRRRRAVDRQAHSDELSAPRGGRGRAVAARPVHGRALSGDRGHQRLDAGVRP